MLINILLLGCLFLVLIFSFYFSGTEAGVLGLAKEKYESDLEKKLRGTLRLRPFINNIPLFLAVVLLGNTFANVTATFLADQLWGNIFGTYYFTTFLLLSTGIFLIFGEILPKILFRRYTPGIIYASVPLLVWAHRLTSPFASFMMLLERFFISRRETHRDELSGGPHAKEFSLTDFKGIVNDSAEEGVFSEKDITFINNLASFSRTKAEEVMEPLVNLIMLQENQNIDTSVLQIIEKRKMRYIPVYRSRIDNLTGFIDILDVFRSLKKQKKVKDFIKKAVYVPETATLESLYRKFPTLTNKLLIVVNEYGGSSGVITLSTIVQKALGLERRYRKKRRAHEPITALGEHRYLIESSLDIDRFNDAFSVLVSKKGFETLGGFLLYVYGQVPEEGMVIVYEKMRFKIIKASEIGIESIELSFSTGEQTSGKNIGKRFKKKGDERT